MIANNYLHTHIYIYIYINTKPRVPQNDNANERTLGSPRSRARLPIAMFYALATVQHGIAIAIANCEFDVVTCV